MAQLSDEEYSILAALLAPAAVLVRARAEAGSSPPATDTTADWLAWLLVQPAERLATLLEGLGENEEFRTAILTLRSTGNRESTVDAPHFVLRTKKSPGLPVVDRHDIWAQLKNLHVGDARILEVRGLARTGKTYVRWLVQEFCNRSGGGHQVKYHDLDGSKTLRDISMKMVSAINSSTVIPKHDEADSTLNAWARSIAGMVFNALVYTAPQLTRWVVVDHFERVRVSEAILFFSELAEQVASAAGDPTIPNGPRLVLIDHGVELTPVASTAALDSEVRQVDQADIESFLLKCQPASTSATADAKKMFDELRAEARQRIDQFKVVDPNGILPDPFMELVPRKLAPLLSLKGGAT